MLARLILATLAVQIFLAGPAPAAQSGSELTDNITWTVGYTRSQTTDPMGGELRYSIWYPSADSAGMTTLGPFNFAAKTDATPGRGKFPLVLLSHGSGGNHLGHRNLGIALAKAGIIAVAPSHPRDNSQDQSGVGHRIVWEGRPLQISAVIDHLLESKQWSPLIDADRIGVFGFSLGGYTALALLGAQPSLSELVSHCTNHDDRDPLCRHGGGLAASMQTVIDEEYESVDSEPPRNLVDSRFCAAAVADPVAAVFSDSALNELAMIPIQIFLPEHENELAAAYNGARVDDILAARDDSDHRPAITMANAHHFTFIAPFPPAVAAQLPAFFKDHEDLDRNAFDMQFERAITEFFVKSLSGCADN